MDINVGNKTNISTDVFNTETAWKIEDAILVLEHLKRNNKIVLGGDILTKNLEHNYDSWYYNVDSKQNPRLNVDGSIGRATEYIANYIHTNGSAFYVIFVIDQAIRTLKPKQDQQTEC